MIDRKNNEVWQAVVTGVVASAVLLGVIYVNRAMDYREIFLPNTYINGMAVGNLSVEDVEEMLGEYQLTVEFREGETVMIEGEEIDYHYVSDGTVADILESQNLLLWLPSQYGMVGNSTNSSIIEESAETGDTVTVEESAEAGNTGESSSLIVESSNTGNFRTFEYSIDTPTAYDPGKLEAVLEEISQLHESNMRAPEDAYVGYDDQTSVFVIVPEVYGTMLDADAAKKYIDEAIAAESTEIDLAGIDGLYENPDIYKDNEILNRDVEVLNELAGASVTYELPGGETKVLDGPQLREWLLTDEDGNYYRDDTIWNVKITEFIAELAAEVNTIYSDHDFETHDGEVITVPGKGYYGYLLNQKEEIAQLAEELSDNTVISREPIYKRTEAAAPDDNYGWGGDYCEINLTLQHLWIYKDYEVVYETDVVSGTNDYKHRTPDGAYFIYNKLRNTILKGDKQDDGTYGYETPVSYWMRITDDGIGLHDASWRSSFGGSIWRWGGSHGCVNLPSWTAADIYELLEEGTPVAIYYEEE